MKNKPPIGRELPPKFKHMIDVGATRKFSWKERIQILIGYRADISVAIICEHLPGKFTPKVQLDLTPELSKTKN